MEDLLIKLKACSEAKKWAAGKTWPEIHATCHRGDWLLWLFKRTNPDDLQPLTLAKALCANTVRHLMKEARSLTAVDTAISFGRGEATREQLDAAYAAYAYAAYAADDAYAYAAYAAAYAADAADAAYAADADAAAYADAAYADAAYADAAYAADAADAARKASQQLTADICRQTLPTHLWNIKI